MTEAATSPVVVSVSNVRKYFGPTRALDGCSFAARAGEIHAIVGGNGCGKSTLAKVISGVLPIDSGAVSVLGEAPSTPAELRAAGIATVYQEILVAEESTVVDNLYMGVDNLFSSSVPFEQKVRNATTIMEELVGQRVRSVRQRRRVATGDQAMDHDRPRAAVEAEGSHSRRILGGAGLRQHAAPVCEDAGAARGRGDRADRHAPDRGAHLDFRPRHRHARRPGCRRRGKGGPDRKEPDRADDRRSSGGGASGAPRAGTCRTRRRPEGASAGQRAPLCAVRLRTLSRRNRRRRRPRRPGTERIRAASRRRSASAGRRDFGALPQRRLSSDRFAARRGEGTGRLCFRRPQARRHFRVAVDFREHDDPALSREDSGGRSRA